MYGSFHWNPFVFASTRKRGKLPYSPDSSLTRSFRPAANRAKIAKHIGWHTFRRTFSTLLKANGEDIKTVQELLRHATVKMTLEVYAQAVTRICHEVCYFAALPTHQGE
ncbi:tyrosine-type recombinase/integrase [Edaphobacter acidisoli]|uniref:tyrosine-type recombinase/integrase n=1 Tax=Edaphobacter acidisoli TaxID=2040573 RepID=UPI001E3B2571|nr:tyrosine-type recombinase/integrase [Edaphobacter acidisoli]